MADLIAQGARAGDRWRRSLTAERASVLGRAGAALPAPWDDQISRRHAELSWDGRRLHVRRLGEARNPIFFQGRASEAFEVAPGEHFVIGSTTFTLADERVNVSLDVPVPLEEQTFSTDYLHSLPFRRVGPHIDVLGRLPEVISAATGDAELSLRLVNLLLAGLPRAGAAALVAVPDASPPQPAPVDVLHWDRRSVMGGEFQPSERLIRDALRRGESVLHVWNAADGAAPSEFTLSQGVDWAFCTPVAGKACRGWALYVAGRFVSGRHTPEQASDPSDLRDDLKFTELAATTLGALCDVRFLERQRAGLSQFFSPLVLDALARRRPGRGPGAARDASHRAVLRLARILADQRTLGRRLAGAAPPREPGAGRHDAPHPRSRRGAGRFSRRRRHGFLGLAAAPARRRAAGRPRGTGHSRTVRRRQDARRAAGRLPRRASASPPATPWPARSARWTR